MLQKRFRFIARKWFLRTFLRDPFLLHRIIAAKNTSFSLRSKNDSSENAITRLKSFSRGFSRQLENFLFFERGNRKIQETDLPTEFNPSFPCTPRKTIQKGRKSTTNLLSSQLFSRNVSTSRDNEIIAKLQRFVGAKIIFVFAVFAR